MDDAFFGGHEAVKRGRGAGNKSKVLIGVESKGKSPGNVAMRGVPALDALSIATFAHDTIVPKITVPAINADTNDIAFTSYFALPITVCS